MRRGMCILILIYGYLLLLMTAGCQDDIKMEGNIPPHSMEDSSETTDLSTPPEFKLMGYSIPPDSDNSYSVDTVDYDRDGDMDILIGNYNGQLRLYRNDGSSRFEEITDMVLPQAILPTRDARFVDIDGDGDQDIVIANEGTENRVYRNDDGIYTDVTVVVLPLSDTSVIRPTRRVLIGDINKDNYPDLIFLNYNLKNLLYYNNGDGSFKDMSDLLPDMKCPNLDGRLIDIDGDYDPDLLIASNGRCDEGLLFINNNGEGFSSGRDILPSPPPDAVSLAVSNIDSNGDLEILFVSDGLIHIYYSNKGIFTFLNLIESASQISIMRMADIDRDGYDDIIIGVSEGGNRLYLNDKRGNFSDVTDIFLPPERDHTRDISMSDIDGDGRIDMIIANDGQNRLYLNKGDHLEDATSSDDLPPDSDSSFMGRLVDVDSDGDPDLIIANFGRDRLYLNNGDGRFTDVTDTHLPDDNGDRTYAVAVGDLNGDGAPDMVFANDESQNRLYINDGTGRFNDLTDNLPEDADSSHDVDLGDVDNDGNLDIIISNIGRQNRLYINDGRGRFKDETIRLPSDSDLSYHAALGDVDRDGDTDIIFANVGSRVRLYLNNEDGIFTDRSDLLPDKISDSDGVALGDLNGDGYPDIFIGNFPFDAGDGIKNWLYLNNKNGSFRDVTGTHLPDTIDQTCNVVISDIDNDGDLDIIASNQGQSRLYLNDRYARFTDVTDSYIPTETDTTRGIEVGDVDGDGDVDMILFNDLDRQNHLYRNMMRK